jgi:hypothetical protein
MRTNMMDAQIEFYRFRYSLLDRMESLSYQLYRVPVSAMMSDSICFCRIECIEFDRDYIVEGIRGEK